MKTTIPLALAAMIALGAGQAQAAGCIKGAIIGGAAGHYLANRHGILGAIAGCVGGRALANRQRNRDIGPPPSANRGYDRGYDNRGGGYAAPSRGTGGYVGY